MLAQGFQATASAAAHLGLANQSPQQIQHVGAIHVAHGVPEGEKQGECAFVR